jgi:hypothetical protein
VKTGKCNLTIVLLAVLILPKANTTIPPKISACFPFVNGVGRGKFVKYFSQRKHTKKKKKKKKKQKGTEKGSVVAFGRHAFRRNESKKYNVP